MLWLVRNYTHLASFVIIACVYGDGSEMISYPDYMRIVEST